MEQIKGAVEALLKGLKSRRTVGTEERILEIFTEKEREHIAVKPGRPGKLRIAVDSSTWLYYFNLRKKALTEKIAEILPGTKELSFFIGEVRREDGGTRA